MIVYTGGLGGFASFAKAQATAECCSLVTKEFGTNRVARWGRTIAGLAPSIFSCARLTPGGGMGGLGLCLVE